MTELPMRPGGEILVRHLMLNGVRRVFMVAGESFLPCIDSLYDHRDEIATVSFRQEGGAAYAAEAHGKLTGETGILLRHPRAGQRRTPASASTPPIRTARR